MKTCKSCKQDGLQSDYAFCPYCGKPVGTKKPEVSEIGPVPNQGITIEFFYSTSSNFSFALEAAKKLPVFKQYGEGKKAVYRATFGKDNMDEASELADYLKGLRKRSVYIQGEKVTWESVFDFAWCYKKRKSSYKPDLYCFGYENEYQLNIWGCLRSEMFFSDREKWFTWGSWVGGQGEWEFDKDRIRHELQKNLYKYRFCPAIQLGLVKDVLEALPDRVNPKKNQDWVYIESWDRSDRGYRFVSGRRGYQEEVVAIGVAPRGPEVIETIMKKLKRGRIPQHAPR